MIDILTNLHLLRPWWLLALIPAAALIWFYSRSHSQSRSWAAIIDQRLLPHVLQGNNSVMSKRRHRRYFILLFLLSSLLIVALAGPVFEQRPQPVFKAQSALVLVLDLSRSMDAADVKPSRLSRAHYKLSDILKQRREGQTALIVYAADAFVVSPLTDDAATIESQISALQTGIMPAQGSRLDRALQKAQTLFYNAGHQRGEIIVLSDSVNAEDIETGRELQQQGFNISVLAIGTADGAPIPADTGGFLKDTSGSIVISKLDSTALQQLAQAGGGDFTRLTASDNDINRLLSGLSTKPQLDPLAETGQSLTTDRWHEEGPWLLLLLIPFAAYAFRRGLVFLLLIFILPMPQPAQAVEWDQLWKNNNQRALQQLQQGNAQQAAELFETPTWQAAAEYRAGNYAKSADILKSIDNADAHYNRGNALAKTGAYDEALQAYKRALELQPEHEDARYNKQQVEQTLQNQQNEKQQSSEDESDSNEPSEDDQSDTNKTDDNQNGDSKSQNNQSTGSQPEEDKSENDQATGDQNNSDPGNDEQSGQNPPQAKPDSSQSEAETAETEQQAQAQQAADKPDGESTDEPLDLQQQQTQQWLKKIPDDPGGLLRRKFHYQYGREPRQDEQQAW
ncbi:MAG TPA: VWA domain-containing protein [Gammaproteobacteria bacterium]